MSKYLTSTSFFSNDRPKTPLKLSTLTQSNMKLAEPTLPSERDYQSIIQAYKPPESRSTSPYRPSTPNNKPEVTPYFNPIENVIIPRPPNSSLQPERRDSTSPLLLPTEGNSLQIPETTTLTPVSNTSATKREPIRIDFVKRKGDEKRGSIGGGTALTSTYEENGSPRLEQRFDIRL